ncbi:hypothetical protein C6499_04565 [Candidatus Poribacteria bacterium]|nr:MAG: hypothetical protein C6499_04565 [Candidatus Poribacteria bacterium]
MADTLPPNPQETGIETPSTRDGDRAYSFVAKNRLFFSSLTQPVKRGMFFDILPPLKQGDS